MFKPMSCSPPASPPSSCVAHAAPVLCPQVACVGLGLVRLLAVQLHLDIHQLDEPPLPAGAANILTLNSLPTTPKSPAAAAGGGAPHHHHHSHLLGMVAAAVANGGGGGGASPLRRSSSGSSSPRPGSAGPGSRRGVLEPSIPEVSRDIWRGGGRGG